MDQYQTAKEEIKGASDIVELIGQFVQLKRAGQNYLGLCPFHSEKAPSFTVSPSKQMFHCFGCKKGGDIFAFWMAYHKVDFPQAFKDLADRYHVQIPQRPLTKTEKKHKELKALLFHINKKAAHYFHTILTESEKGERGRNYFSKRSIPEDIISEYNLGYAPDGWDGLVRFFRSQGMDPEKVVQAGLFIPKKSGGYYDRFRNRVIFPIFDVRGKIVGFGARVLDDSLPKYLNTPETPIFRKGELLYGLQTASRTIRNNDRAVVVEGYTDVLGLRTHGFQEAVATLGTSLTSHHVRMLKGYAQETVVVFDSDSAGEKAALKSLSLFLREGLASRVMILPEGEDPDSFVRKYGLERFLQLLDHAAPMFEYYLDRKIASGHPGVEGKVKVLKEILPLLSTLNDTTQQALYTRRLSEKLDVAESVVLAEIRRLPNQRAPELDKDRLSDRVMSTKVKD
ncbi:DNA primase, partial [Thermodesulfobacteriota bacterium]